MTIHPTAIIDSGATIDSSATIGAYTIIEKDVVIGADTEIGAHTGAPRLVSATVSTPLPASAPRRRI